MSLPLPAPQRAGPRIGIRVDPHLNPRVDTRGSPLNLLAAFGAGVQIHVEDLAADLAGRERVDAAGRWNELQPAYQDLAARIS